MWLLNVVKYLEWNTGIENRKKKKNIRLSLRMDLVNEIILDFSWESESITHIHTYRDLL